MGKASFSLFYCAIDIGSCNNHSQWLWSQQIEERIGLRGRLKNEIHYDEI